jgi:hypothetical protein
MEIHRWFEQLCILRSIKYIEKFQLQNSIKSGRNRRQDKQKACKEKSSEDKWSISAYWSLKVLHYNG